MKFRQNKWDSSLLYAEFNLFSFTLQYAIYRVCCVCMKFYAHLCAECKKSCCRHFGLVSHNNSLNFHSWCTRTLLLSSSRVCVVAQKSASRQFTLIMNYWKCHNSLLQPKKKRRVATQPTICAILRCSFCVHLFFAAAFACDAPKDELVVMFCYVCKFAKQFNLYNMGRRFL